MILQCDGSAYKNTLMNKVAVLLEGFLLSVFLPLKGKQIESKTLRSPRLCGEYCFVKDPFRVII